MGTIYAPTYRHLTMGYHEIKVYSIISQSYPSASKTFSKFLAQIFRQISIITES